MLTKNIVYKYKDKKMLKQWSKGKLANFILQLIDIIETNEYDYTTDVPQELLEELGING